MSKHSDMKVVVACDSMKGSLTSVEVVKAACNGIKDAFPQAEIVALPLADGGEGTAQLVVEAMRGEMVTAQVLDPLMRPIKGSFGVVNAKDGSKTAVIDVASASGLMLLDAAERDAAVTSSFGVGQLMLKAFDCGCRRFIIGLGGSATNDGGHGMLEALGFRFLDLEGRALPQGGLALENLAKIDLTAANAEILGCDITVMCDVDNPLTGPAGASHIYGPQKGASAELVGRLDRALAHFAQIAEKATGRTGVSQQPGAGAAGGLGFAFRAFTRATLRSGIDTYLSLADFDRLTEGADLVITGEGCVDRQTLCGKAPLGVLKRAGSRCPVVAIAGRVEDYDALLAAGFHSVHAVTPADMPLEKAMIPEIATSNVARTCTSVVSQIRSR